MGMFLKLDIRCKRRWPDSDRPASSIYRNSPTFSATERRESVIGARDPKPGNLMQRRIGRQGLKLLARLFLLSGAQISKRQRHLIVLQIAQAALRNSGLQHLNCLVVHLIAEVGQTEAGSRLAGRGLRITYF